MTRRALVTVLLGIALVAGCEDPPVAPPPRPPPVVEPPPVEPPADTPPPEGTEPTEPTTPEGRHLSAGTLRAIGALPHDTQLTFVVARHLPDWYQGWERAVDLYAPLYREAGLSVRILHPQTVPERAEVERLGIQEHQREVANGQGGTDTLVYHRGFAVRFGERVLGTRDAPEPWWLEYEVARRLRPFMSPPMVVGVAVVSDASVREATDCLLDRYQVENVDLAQPIPETISTVLIVQPTRHLSEAEIGHLDAYLDRGGSVGVFGANVQSSATRWNERRGSYLDVGLGPLLARFGITLQNQMVMANACSRVDVQVGGIDRLEEFRAIPQAIFPESGMHAALERGTRTRMPFPQAFSIAEQEGVTQDLVLNAIEGWRVDVPRDLSPATRASITPPSDGTHDDLPLLAFLRRGQARLLFAGAPFFRDDLVREDGCFNTAQEADLNPRVHFVRMVDWLALDLDLVDIGSPSEDQPMSF